MKPFPQAQIPLLYVSAVDAQTGEFFVFTNSQSQKPDELSLCPEALLASSAIPTLFPPVEIKGRNFWDGVFSQNPPIRQLHNADPEEIWIIQINPTRHADLNSVDDIKDRRNELAGNLSLEQEKYFIKKVNEIHRNYGANTGGTTKYAYIALKTIDIPTVVTNASGNRIRLDCWSKLNTSRQLIEDLKAVGRQRATDFMNDAKEFETRGFSSKGEVFP